MNNPNTMRIVSALRSPLLWIVLCGALLRFYGLGNESLWQDEGHTVFLIDKPFLNLADDWTQGPVFYAFEKLACSLFGTSEFALRMMPAIWGILAIPMIFLLGKAMTSRTGGLIAALLLAINPFSIYYSQDARPYSFFLLTSLLALYFTVRWGMEERKHFRYGWVLAVILTMYSHPYGVFVAAASGLVFLFCRMQAGRSRFASDLKQLVITAVFASLFMIPQLWSVIRHFLSSAQSGKTQVWLVHPHLGTLVYSFADMMMTSGGVITVFGFAGLIALIWTYRAKQTSFQTRAAMWVSLLWIGMVMLLPMLLSFAVVPFYTARYAIPALIGLILLMAAVFAEWKPKMRTFGMAAVIVLCAHSLYSFYTLRDKDPWRETAEVMESHVRADENVVVYPGYQRLPLDYYLDGSSVHPIYLNPEGTTGILPTDKDVLWWVQGYDWYAVDTLSYTEDLKRQGYKKESEIQMTDVVKKNPRAYYMADIRLIRYVRVRER